MNYIIVKTEFLIYIFHFNKFTYPDKKITSFVTPESNILILLTITITINYYPS